MKPLLGYYGGKQKIASWIIPNFPPHNHYVEPFGGGASLLFAKPQLIGSNRKNNIEVINDVNNVLITFYRVAQEKPRQLERKIKGTLFAEVDYSLSKKILKNSSAYSDMDIAWAVYTNLNQAFGHIMNGGWGGGR